MTKRIIFINGLGNLTYQSTALLNKKTKKSENILFLITEYNLPKIQRDNCLKVAKISNLFEAIYDLGNINSDFHYPNLTTQKLLYESVFNKIKTLLGDNYIDEIWTYKLDASFMHFILHKYSNAKVIFTDNGLASYREIPIIKESKTKECKYEGIYESHIKRLVKIYLTISEILPLSNYMLPTKSEILTKKHFLEYFNLLLENEYIEKLVKKGIYLSNKRNVLVVGSSFHRLGIITKLEEKRAYEVLIKKLIKDGYRVFWKPHPRDKYINFYLLKNIITLDDILPIELYAYKIKFDMAISISSSALLVLYKLFNTKSLYLNIKFRNKDKIPPHIKQLHNILGEYLL